MPKATDYIDLKISVPSEMRTREWDRVSAWCRERAFFMASVANAEVLDEFRRTVRQATEGRMSAGEARDRLRRYLQDAGYRAAEGLQGTIKDLATEQRMNVALQTNTTMAREWARRQQALADAAHPGWELYRAKAAVSPRDWPTRWQQAAEAVGWEGVARSGAMIALVTSPIWRRLSAFGQPYPPFDWGSKMRTRPVDYRTCEQLGLVGAEAEAAAEEAPAEESFNAHVEVTPRVHERALMEELERQLQGVAHREGDKLVLNDANGTRPVTWREAGDVIAGEMSEAAEAAGLEQRQKRAAEIWCGDSSAMRGPVQTVKETNEYGEEEERSVVSLDEREDMSRLVERIVPVESDSEDGGPIGRALHFNSVRDAADVLNRLLDDGTYSAHPNSIGESWNNNVQTTQRYADGKVNVILRCEKYHSRKRLDGLYPYLNIPKHYEGGAVASEGESIMPGSCRFGNAKLVRQSRNKLGGWDYEFEIEEMED